MLHHFYLNEAGIQIKRVRIKRGPPVYICVEAAPASCDHLLSNTFVWAVFARVWLTDGQHFWEGWVVLLHEMTRIVMAMRLKKATLIPKTIRPKITHTHTHTVYPGPRLSVGTIRQVNVREASPLNTCSWHSNFKLGPSVILVTVYWDHVWKLRMVSVFLFRACDKRAGVSIWQTLFVARELSVS